MTRKTGFTLIELLVVIAIIAILAAIIFPVFMKAKENAYRAGDMSNMNTIRNALQLYRADQEAYPPQILGYASFYAPALTQVIPADQLRTALYPKRIDSLQTTRPAFDRFSMTDLIKARWPHKDSRQDGTAPILDLDGNGIIETGTNKDDPPPARQAYDQSLWFCTNTASCDKFSTQTVADAAQFYAISGYDVAEVKEPPAGGPNSDVWELHYTLRWSSYSLGGGNRFDDPRQLIYSNPPDNTVVTWDSWFRDYDSGNLPIRAKKDFVLFLGGSTRPYDSAMISDRSWRVTP